MVPGLPEGSLLRKLFSQCSIFQNLQ